MSYRRSRCSSTTFILGPDENKLATNGLGSREGPLCSPPVQNSDALQKSSSIGGSETSSLVSAGVWKEPPPCPNHEPFKSALSLPTFSYTPDTLLQLATWDKPVCVVMVILCDHEPCCDCELRVRQGNYVTAFFKRKQWVYAQILKTSQAGYVPSALCCRASLHQPSIDSGVGSEAYELEDSLSDLRQNSPSTMRNFPPAACTRSPHRRRHASTADCRGTVSDSEVGGCTRRAVSLPATPQRQMSSDNHQYRPHSLSTTTYQSPPKRPETHLGLWPASTNSMRRDFSQHHSDTEQSKHSTLPVNMAFSNTPPDTMERSRKWMIMRRLRNFRTNGPNTVYEVFSSQGNLPTNNDTSNKASTVETAHAPATGKTISKKLDTQPTQNGESRHIDVNPKLSRRSFFSRLSGRRKSRGSQTDTEAVCESRKSWRDLEENAIQTDTEASATRSRYFPVRLTSSVTTLPSSEQPQNQQDRPLPKSNSLSKSEERLHRRAFQPQQSSLSTSSGHCSRISQAHIQPCVVQFDFFPERPNQLAVHRGQHVWQLNTDETARQPASQPIVWVQVLDPLSKNLGYVPRACLSPFVQSTIL